MDVLVDIVNKLQDIYATSEFKDIDLPQIVVVGTQSSGKSSVLEQIVGESFLPRGIGVVTRCPIVLQMMHAPEGTLDYAIFTHKPQHIFNDYNLIRNEIQDRTNELAGENKGICKTPIMLKMYSSSFVNLTLIDLPGTVKNPVGDQPPDIEQQVRDLIYSYISKENCLILAISPANADLATSESLKIAAEVDRNEERTLSVITKLDLMDKGTDAWDMLQGKVIPVKLGIIGVVNRSQMDIKDQKSIKESMKYEEKFLKKHYASIASFHGSRYLTKTVQVLLINHIRSCLPKLKDKILEKLAKRKQEFAQYEENDLDKDYILHELLSNFSRTYVAALKGKLTSITTDELYGGARIKRIFRDFSNAMYGIEALAGLKDSHLLTAIDNASGVTPAIFVPEVAFELLVKRQIEKFRGPSLHCLELVLGELKNIVHSCLAEMNSKLERFPKLQTKLDVTMKNILESCIPQSKEMVTKFIDVQIAHINTDHGEFFPNLNQPKALAINLPNRAGSQDKKSFDLNITRTLINSYFAIVRKTIEDTIPKIIMYGLVNTVMERVERELNHRLSNQADDLLSEPQIIIEKRETLQKEITQLEEVLRSIYSLSTSVNESITGFNL